MTVHRRRKVRRVAEAAGPALDAHKIEIPQLNLPAPLAGFGSSRSSADINLCFFPFDELRFSGLDIAFALPQLFLVPGGRFDRARICRQALPKRFHRLQLFFDAHFVQWENRNAHGAHYNLVQAICQRGYCNLPARKLETRNAESGGCQSGLSYGITAR